ncbi:MAG: alpha/beta hydrolase [Beijerinckiaceae bacterium]
MSAFVDLAMARIIASIKSAPAMDLRALPVAQARAAFTAQQIPWAWCPDPMADVRDISITTPGGAMAARLYLPANAHNQPVVIFAHGGGWTFGNIATHDGTMRMLAAASGCAVLGIDYRLAPEHPFPAGHEDMLAAIAFVRSGALAPHCDGTRIALAGDSAGANLALGAMLGLRETGQPQPATACLFYGCYAPIFDTPSHEANGGGDYLLTTDMMRWYWGNFLGSLTAEDAPAACAPLFADLKHLPPLYLNAAGLDPLLDDTMILSARLAEDGVRHTLDLWPGVTHGFLRLARELPAAREAIAAAGRHLKLFFNETQTS